ncbi:MAG: DUF1501 domain-containing protein [Gemmataceae bacterium]|nr:DUF1501 domain-containing protein [Gemmataceae bacterium]
MASRMQNDCEGFFRRDFLRIGAGAGLLGLSLPELLRLEAMAAKKGANQPAKKADSVIMVWLAGGPATIDMWDLKPEAPEGIRGAFKPADTNVPGIRISEHMPKMAKVADKISIIRSIYHSIPSHGPATVFMTTGNKPTAALQYPAMGSVVSKVLAPRPGVPQYVSFSDIRGGLAGNSGYLGTAYSPFMVEGNPNGGKTTLRVRGIQLPTNFTLDSLANRDDLLAGFDSTFRETDKNADLVQGFDAFHKQALEILRSDKTRNAFDLTQEKQETRARYGMEAFGQSALAARRLVEAGVRFVTISIGGWDTHGKTFEAHSKRLQPTLDNTLSALIADLSDRGMLDRTMVYCAGEFGRTPKINKNDGRDHWARSMSVVAAGGGFKRGYAHGTTDGQGMAPATEACLPDDVSSTIFHNLGIDPKTELQTSTGRPITLFREGAVIDKLLA